MSNNNTAQIISEVLPLITALAAVLPSAINVISSIEAGTPVSDADLATYQAQRKAAYTAMVNALVSDPTANG